MNAILPQPVTASLVPLRDRMAFLPRLLGARMIRGEFAVYDWMGRLAPAYHGGLWKFYTLSNGGFYLAPDVDTPFKVEVSGNYFSRELSADAAGIVATLFALCQLVEEAAEEGADDQERLADHYHALRAFAGEHVEGGLIFAAID